MLDVAKPWTREGKNKFCQMLKGHTELETVKFKTVFADDPHADFRHEIEFYTNKKHHGHKAEKKFEKRQEGCEPESMFENMLQLLEKKKNHKKMPVRKFFNNTFGTILNDALFALKKKQSKEPENKEIFTNKGAVKYVALFLLENLPQNEREPDLYNSSDSHDEV